MTTSPTRVVLDVDARWFVAAIRAAIAAMDDLHRAHTVWPRTAAERRAWRRTETPARSAMHTAYHHRRRNR